MRNKTPKIMKKRNNYFPKIKIPGFKRRKNHMKD